MSDDTRETAVETVSDEPTDEEIAKLQAEAAELDDEPWPYWDDFSWDDDDEGTLYDEL